MKNCWLPYYHAEIDGLRIRPCCKYEADWLSDLNSYSNADRSEFETVELSKNCSPCTIENSYKKIKTREFLTMGLGSPKEPRLLSINLVLDNICSNTCLMCEPAYSSAIGFLLKKQTKVQFNLDTLDTHLDTIRHISILGGEPLQSPNLVKLCEKLKESKLDSVNILTSLNTCKKDNINALLSLNTRLNFRVSIDGPHDLNEWIRGCDKDYWLRSLEEIQKIGTVNWQVTLGNYNIFALTECLDYLEQTIPNQNVLPSIVYSPKQCAVAELPDIIKEQTRIKISSYKTKPNNTYIVRTALELLSSAPSLDWNHCKSHIERLPRLRGETVGIEHFIEKYLRIR